MKNWMKSKVDKTKHIAVAAGVTAAGLASASAQDPAPPIDVSSIAATLVTYVGIAGAAGALVFAARYGIKVIISTFRGIR